MRKLKNVIWKILFFSFIITKFSLADSVKYDQLFSIHSANIIDRGDYSFSFNMLRNGGVLGIINIGLFDKFNMGISYGGDNVIGSGEINFFSEPGVQVKYKIIKEKENIPDISIGYDSQEVNKLIRAPWLYVSLSKRVGWSFGKIDLHGVINYNPKDNRNNRINLSFGSMFIFENDLYLGCEYNCAFDEETNENVDSGGYFNLLGKIYINPNFEFNVTLSDLLGKKEDVVRELRLVYYSSFLDK